MIKYSWTTLLNKTTSRSPPLAFPHRTQTRNQDKRQYKSSQASPLECKHKRLQHPDLYRHCHSRSSNKTPQENDNASKKNKTRKQRAIAHWKKVSRGIEIVGKRERERAREREEEEEQQQQQWETSDKRTPSATAAWYRGAERSLERQARPTARTPERQQKEKGGVGARPRWYRRETERGWPGGRARQPPL
jgi:hypothetical protein